MTVQEMKDFLRSCDNNEFWRRDLMKQKLFGSEEPFDTQACTPEDRQRILADIKSIQHSLNQQKKMLSKLTQALLH